MRACEPTRRIATWVRTTSDSSLLSGPGHKHTSHSQVRIALCFKISCRCSLVVLSKPRSGELRTQKLKSHLVRTQSLNVLPLKPGVGQYIALHATLTARDFFLAYFYTSGPFTCIFSKTSPDIFPVLALANTWFLCRPAE